MLLLRCVDMGDMDCKCASNLFQQGNEQQFVPCCDKLNTWIKASLTDEEQLKKIWRVSEGSEKDAFKVNQLTIISSCFTLP